MSFDISPEALTERWYKRWQYTHYENGWIYGTWYCGTGFQKSVFYGQFPTTFVNRITTAFPTDKVRFLHLCCGGCNIPGAMNVDAMLENKSPGGQANKRNPDIVADAESLPRDKFPENSYDVCLIDPPYTPEDAKTRYGLSRLVRPSLVFNELYRILPVGGYVLWYDEKPPQVPIKQWDLMGLIGIVKGRNRRWVGLNIFRKLDAGDWKQFQKEDIAAEFDKEDENFKENIMTESQIPSKRIKRTKEQIAAGVTLEQAKAARTEQVAAPAVTLNPHERLTQLNKEIFELTEKRDKIQEALNTLASCGV